jgi:hypothetical protein
MRLRNIALAHEKTALAEHLLDLSGLSTTDMHAGDQRGWLQLSISGVDSCVWLLICVSPKEGFRLRAAPLPGLS